MAQEVEAVIPQLVIPMTGISARFTAEGYDLPKFMLEANGQLVIDHVLDMYPGWSDVIFICNALHLDNPVLDLERHLLARRPSARIVRVEETCKGPGEAVLLAAELIDRERPVVVNYCDFTVYWNSDDLLELLMEEGVDGVIPVYSGFHPHTVYSTSYAYVRMEGNRAVDIQEKQPWTNDPISEMASTGTYAFRSGALLLESLNRQVQDGLTLKDEYYLSLTYKPIFADGGTVKILLVQHFMQWGTPQDLEEYLDISRGLERWSRPRVSGDVEPSASRVMLAAGAGARFADAGYVLPKPALPLAGRSVLEHALAGLPGTETVVVTRRDLPDSGLVNRLATLGGYSVEELPGLSRGQAESALRGIERLTKDGPVTIGACDALTTLSGTAFERAVHAIGPDGLAVWTSPSYPAARRNPRQYGWISYDDDARVTQSWLKQIPESSDAHVILGTFTFGSRSAAIRHIGALLQSEETVRGEYYLDSIVNRLLQSGEPVVALEVDGYLSVGTPAEYETLLYWQSCFHKWVHHPYELIEDPLVLVRHRAALDQEFRRFAPRLAEELR